MKKIEKVVKAILKAKTGKKIYKTAPENITNKSRSGQKIRNKFQIEGNQARIYGVIDN